MEGTLMKVFVTGGAGYVGSHCVKALIEAGHSVTVFDNLSKGHREAVHPSAGFVEGDLADTPLVGEVLRRERFDAVMHFAAFLNVGESVGQPLKYFRNNVSNTVELLEQMKQAEVRKLVFSSTCAVYGEPEDLPITEDETKSPINPYGETKLAMEWALQDCARAWGLGSTALRYFNASGAAADGSIGQDYKPTVHLIPVVLEVALGQRDVVKVFGSDYPTADGSCIRDYIHVEDLASAHVRALEQQPEGKAQAFNVGTGQGTSVFEVISAAREITGHAIPIEVSPRRPGDPPELYANADKIRHMLGWAPHYRDIRDIVASAWAWHSKHPEGYASS